MSIIDEYGAILTYEKFRYLTSANPTQIWSFILSHIWLLGVGLMLSYALISFLLIKRRVA